MKNFVQIATEWGKRLSTNINHDCRERAISQNEWFSDEQINMAIDAIVSMMLQREGLEEWLKHYPTPSQKSERVLIVMAGNLPLVGFFDLLCVIAAGHTALVKPSHKDRVLIEWVISELHAIAPDTPIYIYNDTELVDRVIATGSDTTRRHFEAKYPNTPTLLRGTRHSAAIITDDDVDLTALSDDIFSYSGLGCRNVSLLFVPKDFSLEKIPTAATHPKHRNNYLHAKALLTLNNTPHFDSGSHCIVESHEFPNEISMLSIIKYNKIDEVEQWIEQHDEAIQCIVANRSAITHPRRVDFGRAQYPSLLDYADGVDTMMFLLK